MRSGHGIGAGAAAFAALALLAGCTSGSSQIETSAELPRPQVVVVQDFAVVPGEVQLDPGLSATIRETLQAAASTEPSPAEQFQVGRRTADALADKLVIEIRDLGFEAQRGPGLPPGVETGLVVGGQFVAIDQGDRAERVAIGLGAGRSDVRVRAQVFEVGPRGRTLVDEIEVDAKSGLAPGMAETMGAGALTGHLVASTLVGGGLHVADESLGTSVVADSDRAAKGIAKQLAQLFAEQGWTP
jgi:Domain of unknown function (DUF4410)